MVRTKLCAKIVFIFGSLIWFSLVVSSCVTSGDYGLQSARKGDFKAGLIKPLAEEGNAEAQYWMGIMYYNGLDVPKDLAEAVKWFCLSAEQGYSKGQVSCGELTVNGHGVSQDSKKGIKLLRLAVEQGEAGGMFALSEVYYRGNRGPKNNVYAYSWNKLAAAVETDSDWLKELQERKEKIVKEMTSAQIEEAEALAKQCLDSNYKDCD